MTKNTKKLVINIVSESDISVQGHGVHTAYDEMASALERHSDIAVIRGEFNRRVDCDVVHLHTIGIHAFFKLLRRGRAKVVISAHVVPDSLVGSIALAKYWLFFARWYMRWFYSRADIVLAVSGAVAETLHQELHISRSKIEVFYNTIDMAQYTPTPASKQTARKKLGISSQSFVVFGNGQIQPRKRVDMFRIMAKELPGVQFIWAGGIPFKQLGADYAVMKKLSQNPPKNLRFAGIIPHEQMIDYLHAADVFCLPAEQENHPMCVLEAAGAALPILVRDIPEYDDTFGHDVIRCNDETFKGKIIELRDSAESYVSWQKKSITISEKFDSKAAADRYVALYQRLMNTTVSDEMKSAPESKTA